MQQQKFASLLDQLAMIAGYKLTYTQAMQQQACVVCGKHVTFMSSADQCPPGDTYCYSPQGQEEYARSGYCEVCFDEMFAEERKDG